MAESVEKRRPSPLHPVLMVISGLVAGYVFSSFVFTVLVYCMGSLMPNAWLGVQGVWFVPWLFVVLISWWLCGYLRRWSSIFAACFTGAVFTSLLLMSFLIQFFL